VWIHIKGLDYDKCRSELISLYGGPESEREEPYAEVNGGAVTWARFTDDDTIIRLSRASEREYVELDLEKAKN
ncbi:MAG: hypothetical protein IJ736_15545, partial [Firmicutes bacterium]|nr:hypothetical protein [Bacillota bacterium]